MLCFQCVLFVSLLLPHRRCTHLHFIYLKYSHERSCESDLVLAIIKEFMIAHPRSKLKLVLMSATFNHSQYTSFFRGVPGCDYVDTITIQTANSLDAFYSKVQTYYLEDISKMLARSTYAQKEDYIDYCLDMNSDPMGELSAADGGKALSYELLTCIMSLVHHLHKTESPDLIFLIFAPTYRKSLALFGSFVTVRCSILFHASRTMIGIYRSS